MGGSEDLRIKEETELHLFFEQVRRKANIVDFLKKFVELKTSEDSSMHLANCPFHAPAEGRKTYSFIVDPVQNMWSCSECGTAGDIIDFVQAKPRIATVEKSNISYQEAALFLASREGIAIPKYLRREMAGTGGMAGISGAAAFSLEQVLPSAAEFYSRNISGFKFSSAAKETVLEEAVLEETALEHMKKKYMLNEETVSAFGVGFASPKESSQGLKRFLLEKGFDIRAITRQGLAVPLEGRLGSVIPSDYSDSFSDSIMLQLRDEYGSVMGFAALPISAGSISPSRNDFNYTPETVETSKGNTEKTALRRNAVLFGLDLAAKYIAETGEAVLLDNYLDVMRFWQHGIRNAVAPCSDEASLDQMAMLKRYAKKIVIAYNHSPDKIQDAASAIQNEYALKTAQAAFKAGFAPQFVKLAEKPADADSFIRYLTDYFGTPRADFVSFLIERTPVPENPDSARELLGRMFEYFSRADFTDQLAWTQHFATVAKIDARIVSRWVSEKFAERTPPKQEELLDPFQQNVVKQFQIARVKEAATQYVLNLFYLQPAERNHYAMMLPLQSKVFDDDGLRDLYRIILDDTPSLTVAFGMAPPASEQVDFYHEAQVEKAVSYFREKFEQKKIPHFPQEILYSLLRPVKMQMKECTAILLQYTRKEQQASLINDLVEANALKDAHRASHILEQLNRIVLSSH